MKELPPLSPLTPKPDPKSKKKPRSRLRTVLFRVTIFFSLLFVALGIGTGVALFTLYYRLPDVRQLENYTLPQATEIYTQSGQLLTRISSEGRYDPIGIDELPKYVGDAIIQAEDRRFWEHDGIDYWGLLRAVVMNIKNPNYLQGASTLTQQLIKNLFLSSERKIQRKIAEALLAIQLEQKYSKHQILEMYLNLVFLGHNVYGVEAASQVYFGKSARNITLAEAALLAGIIRSPEYFSPYYRPEDAHKLKEIILRQMLEDGRISQEDHDKAQKQKINLVGLRTSYPHPYFLDYVMYTLRQNYGDVFVRQGGWKVYTTINPKAQAWAEHTLQSQASWLKRNNAEQAALVSLDPQTGYIHAMVGGLSYQTSQFNRAFQAQRQVGSTFKPFVYLAALEDGMSMNDTIEDAPTSFGGYRPRNYDRRYHGKVSLLTALTFSYNIPTVKLAARLGMDRVIATARKAGVKSKIEPDLTSALGSSEMNLLEITSAYGTFATGGMEVAPTAITKIVDAEGNTLWEYFPPRNRVLDKSAVAQLNRILQNVIQAGTGTAAQIGRPAAGKTGTTDNSFDAWFVGYTPNLVTGIWVGNDTPSATRGAGGSLCAPLWSKYMQQVILALPALSFEGPEASIPTQEPSEEMTDEPTSSPSPEASGSPTPFPKELVPSREPSKAPQTTPAPTVPAATPPPAEPVTTPPPQENPPEGEGEVIELLPPDSPAEPEN